MAQSVDEFVVRLPGGIREIVLALRRQVEDATPDAPQAIKYDALCFFKGKRPFVGISPHQRHVSVIFDRGAELADPDGLLEGSGKARRQITVRDLGEIDDLPIRDYVRESFGLG